MYLMPFQELVHSAAHLRLSGALDNRVSAEHLTEETLDNISKIKAKAVSSVQAIGQMVYAIGVSHEPSPNYEAGCGEALELLADLIADLTAIEKEILERKTPGQESEQ